MSTPSNAADMLRELELDAVSSPGEFKGSGGGPGRDDGVATKLFSGQKTGLLVVRVGVDGDVDVCRGVIGNIMTGRFCGARDCGKTKHTLSKVELAPDHAYICNATGIGAFRSPSLDLTLVPSHLNDILLLKQTVEAHQRMFVLLSDSTSEDLERMTVESISREMSGRVRFGPATPGPAAKRIRLGDDSPMSENTRVNRAEAIPRYQEHMDSDQLLAEGWNVMADLLENLEANLLRTTDGATEEVNQAFTMRELDEKVAVLRARIGSAPEGDAFMPDLWGNVEDLVGGVEMLRSRFLELQEQVGRLEVRTAEGEKYTKKELWPVVERLYQMAMATRAGPAGNISAVGPGASSSDVVAIRASVDQLKQRLRVLEAAQVSSSSANAAGTPWGADAFKALQSEVKTLQVQATEKSVTIAGQYFGSCLEVEDFLLKHLGSRADQYIGAFGDITTLFESALYQNKTSEETTHDMYRRSKANLGGDTDAIVVRTSFQVEVPAIFGSSKLGTAGQGKLLPALPDYAAWDTKDGQSGLSPRMDRHLELVESRMDAKLSLVFTDAQGPARRLAQVMAEKTAAYWRQYQSFVNNFRDELVASSADSSQEEAWDLLCTILHKIFLEFARVRSEGQHVEKTGDPVRQTAVMLWAMLQAHRLMKELVDCRFKTHPLVVPSLVLFLFKNRAPTSALARLRDQLAEEQKNTRTLQASLDKLTKRLEAVERKKNG